MADEIRRAEMEHRERESKTKRLTVKRGGGGYQAERDRAQVKRGVKVLCCSCFFRSPWR